MSKVTPGSCVPAKGDSRGPRAQMDAESMSNESEDLICSSAQQALEQSFEENAVTQSQPGEFSAHAFARNNAADNRVRLDTASGDFKDEYQLRAHGLWIVRGNKQATHP